MSIRKLLASLLAATLLTSIAARADSSNWTVVPSPNPNAQDIFQAVSGISGSEMWAVGIEFNADYNEFTLAEHWNGTAWTVFPTPNPGSNSIDCAELYQNDLAGVAEVSANDVWAVGQYCISGQNGDASILTLTEHWDGSQWSMIPSPNPSQSSSLFGVTAVATNNVWAVGQNYSDANGIPGTLIEHWDGNQWSVVPSPNPSGSTAYLAAVAAVSSTDIWAVGYAGTAKHQLIPLAEHYDGQTWNLVDVPHVYNSPFNWFNAIAVIASDDIWAVGYENYDGQSSAQTGLFEHWDGKAWSLVNAPAIGITGGTQLFAVAAISSKNVWAFGSTWNNELDVIPLMEHWNGTKWTVLNSPPNPGGQAAQYFGATALPGSLWAVGDYGNVSGAAVADPQTLVINNN
jgi:hypothetical protein